MVSLIAVVLQSIAEAAARRYIRYEDHCERAKWWGPYRCVVPECTTVFNSNSPDRMYLHYRKSHMFGDAPKGKKFLWISIERARELGLGHMDTRVEHHLRVKEEPPLVNSEKGSFGWSAV